MIQPLSSAPLKWLKRSNSRRVSFCRIAYRWCVIEFIARMVADPRFGGVRENKAHFRVVRQFQEFIVFTVDADFTINRANQTRVADRFPLLIQATDNGGVQTIPACSVTAGMKFQSDEQRPRQNSDRVCSFRRSICQSTKARRKLPSPN
ncbi:Uncharacterised protein [Escherichia coli]|uniref:Uncharacterized protein n=1 Tax=Escherichia coli TaxID=562 RepID=A0A376KU20_ECOLX|nr:Uncharacterised protein [Escherichia coli]